MSSDRTTTRKLPSEATIKRKYSGDKPKRDYALAYLKYRLGTGNCPKIQNYAGLSDKAAELIRKYVKGE